MTTGYALAIKRLYGPGIVRVAAKHNLREIAAEIGVDGHIDPARIGDNLVLRGPSTADGVAQLAKSLMDAAGVLRCRKTAVLCLELLFTLPAGTAIDLHQYFEQAASWAECHFGVPVLSCVAHMDEGAPHAHALLLPLVNGRMGGSDLHGGKAKLWAMQASFHDDVGSRHGLARQSPQKRLSASVRSAAMTLARECLQANSALNDAVVGALLAPHAKDPAPLLLALGIAMPTANSKAKTSFAAIMTRPMKPEPRNPIGKEKCNPIGIAVLEAASESHPDIYVGIGFPTAPNSNAEQLLDAMPASTQRQATADQAATEPAPPPKHRKQAAQTSTSANAPTNTELSATDHSPPPAARQGARTPDHSQAPQLSANERHGPVTAPAECAPSAHTGDYQRQRDEDVDSALWNEQLGEFVKHAVEAPPTHRRIARDGNTQVRAPSIPPALQLPPARAAPPSTRLTKR